MQMFNITLDGKMSSGTRSKGQNRAERNKCGAALSIIPPGMSLWRKLDAEHQSGFVLGKASWKGQKVGSKLSSVEEGLKVTL